MSFQAYRDDFEIDTLDLTKWHARQVPDIGQQIAFSNDAPSGNQSILISVRDGDGGVSCNNCQRAEIRAHGSMRPLHGDEFWQGFSFRVSGDIPHTGSKRTVLGQWKAPGDESPFLAQRFDNGVFHITVQDGPDRRTIASAEGDPDRLDTFQDLIATLSQRAPEVLSSIRALAKLKRFDKDIATIAEINDANLAEYLVNASAAVESVIPTTTQELFNEFAFVDELEFYEKKANFSIARHGDKKLPDAKSQWVRMAYRIKIGREDNDPQFGPQREGEIDVYANGELIAEVRGNIGYQLKSEPPHRDLYFKFGIYRKKIPGTLTTHFDNFAQGTSFSDVM